MNENLKNVFFKRHFVCWLTSNEREVQQNEAYYHNSTSIRHLVCKVCIKVTEYEVDNMQLPNTRWRCMRCARIRYKW